MTREIAETGAGNIEKDCVEGVGVELRVRGADIGFERLHVELRRVHLPARNEVGQGVQLTRFEFSTHERAAALHDLGEL